MTETLYAGISAVDITPAKGLELAGYPHFPRHNTGAHDPLMASCLFLKRGETAFAVVGMDLLFFSRKHVLAVRQRVSEATGMLPENIMFSCSHTHSGPWAAGRLDMDALLEGRGQDAGFVAELCDKLVQLVVSASRTTFACEVGFASAPCGRERNIGGNRRDPVNGPCDPHVYVLSVRDTTGAVRGMLVNYAVHPTLLHADNTLCTADYPGYLRSFMKTVYPQATLVFGLGAAGDQSSRYFRTGQSFEEARRFGFTIGEAARQAIEQTVYSGGVVLGARCAPVCLELRRLPPRAEAERHVAEKTAEYNRLVAENAPYIDVQNANVAMLGAEDILGYVLMQESGRPMELTRDELPAEVCVFSIGDCRLVGFPGEVFVGIALELRRRAPTQKLILNTVTNGCLPGYVYTREDAALGGYEVDTSMLNQEAGYRMLDAALELMEADAPEMV